MDNQIAKEPDQDLNFHGVYDDLNRFEIKSWRQLSAEQKFRKLCSTTRNFYVPAYDDDKILITLYF